MKKAVKKMMWSEYMIAGKKVAFGLSQLSMLHLKTAGYKN
jgi:hypothetical protein